MADGHAPGGRVGVRTYVLDTSVLLNDPRAILRFAEHKVVLPVTVVTELEPKRHHPELGYFARSALRLLDDLRVQDQGVRLRPCWATSSERCVRDETTRGA